ncbi:MAG TPA: glucosaminidase domain-containing protein, partial [Chitinophagaceae bacterium]
MQKIRRNILFFLLLAALTSRAQTAEVIRGYIDTYKELAIQEMLRTGVPASITLAQGIHESGAGMSPLVLASNNHFGIKCKSNWSGESIKHDDDAKGECFRKYPSAEDSYKDHSDF